MTILIVEDQEIARVGLKVILDAAPGLSVVGMAGDGRESVMLASSLQPKVVLMDIGLPLMDGIEATGQIKEQAPNVRIIMLTSHDDDKHIFAALGAGADGYCLKEAPADQLLMAIRAVAEGVAWLDPGIASRVLRASVGGSRSLQPEEAEIKSGSILASLSQRELDVLRLVVDGNTNQSIAERLSISVETVKTHMRHIMEKLAVSDRTQAAVKAMREGLL
ncbi:MAG: response regulator transcription factor [Cyanobacteria bacterium]|nr:response regulator transcription factor [Cyanobacteriota bacterium]